MISSKSTNLYELNNLIYKCSKKDNICCKYGHRMILVQGPKLNFSTLNL